MLTEKTSKNIKKFECEICDFVCCKKGDYTRHVSTGKHKMLINANKKTSKSATVYECECGKGYNQISSLSRHKKVCKYVEEKKTTGQKDGGENNEVVIHLMNNVIAPLVKQVNDIIPMIGNNNNNTNNNTTNNNKFNLNIYLNDKCKDAISLVDFIENLKITDKEFDTTRTEGIVSGLTDIFTKELRNLDVRQLPIHCSDLKRETFYIKEEDAWIKDDSEKTILSKAICKAKDKANMFLPKWLEEHPLCWKQDNNYHNEWMNIVTVRYGKGDPNFNEKNTKKILKTLANEVMIDKERAMVDDE